MNNITVAGRVGKEPEMRHLQDGSSVLSFSVADDQGKDKPAIWWNCSLFGKRAESLAPYITKGASLTVSGNITEREYTDKEGNQRKAMSVRISDLALQGGRKESNEQAPAPRQAQKPAPKSKGVSMDEFEDSDVPFVSCAFGHDTVTSKAKRMSRYDF